MRATLDARGCTHCHEEHRGLRGLVIREQSLCLDCHRNLAATAPKSGLASVTGFPNGHPQFRATLVADPLAKTLARQEIGAKPAPKDHPGLHFSHQVHLRKGGYPTLGPVIGKELACADCHKPEPSGQGFMPITYAQQCQSCHALKFDRTALPWPDGVVPHHDDLGIVAAVWNYFAAKALQGETGAAAQPAPAVSRQAAGAAPATAPPPPPKDAQAWVAARAESALRDVISMISAVAATATSAPAPREPFRSTRSSRRRGRRRQRPCKLSHRFRCGYGSSPKPGSITRSTWQVIAMIAITRANPTPARMF